MKNTQIEKIANEILSKTKLNNSAPLDIMSLAKQLDFVVGNAKLSDNDDGFILVDRNVTATPFCHKSDMLNCQCLI